MGTGSPWGWLYLTALGLGLLLSSLLRRRAFFWKVLGVSLILLSQGGALVFSHLYHGAGELTEIALITGSLTLLFTVLSIRMEVLIPFSLLLVSGYFLFWGSSGVFTAERGVYPLKITSYPSTEQDRTYHLLYRDGREDVIAGTGPYLVLEKIVRHDYLVLLPEPAYPVGFTWDDSPKRTPLDEGVEATVGHRPGLTREPILLGPFEADPFYSWWVYRDGKGHFRFSSLPPWD